ncbi:MAG: sugar ABC transporter permease YjfF [Clostridia bacterium]|nr:sugar ABC transporter permease YjfF [Clostridia bacterium]
MTKTISGGNRGKTQREPIANSQLLFIIAVAIFVLLYCVAIIFFGNKGFLKPQTLLTMFNENAALIIVACGLTIVMITGGIDISVGAVIALVSISGAKYLQNGGEIWVSVLMALGIGLAFGIFQGFLISYLKIQPFIITLAGMFLARGLVTVVSKEGISLTSEAAPAFIKLKDFRISIDALGSTDIKGLTKKVVFTPGTLEVTVIVALIILLAVALMLKKTRLGRHFYAVGGNPQSALMLGCNVQRVRFHAYIISGLLAGIAGYVNLMHKGAGNPTMAAGMEMDAIASSIIGGTMLSGGVGNVFGTLFGVLNLSTIKNIVQVSGISNGGKEWWQNITTGGMLCIFIVMQSIILFARGKSSKKKAENKPLKN